MEEFLVDEELEERTSSWVGLSTINEFELEFEQYERKRLRLVATEPEGGDAKLVSNDGLMVVEPNNHAPAAVEKREDSPPGRVYEGLVTIGEQDDWVEQRSSDEDDFIQLTQAYTPTTEYVARLVTSERYDRREASTPEGAGDLGLVTNNEQEVCGGDDDDGGWEARTSDEESFLTLTDGYPTG